ncbi:putative SNF2 family N-terminal domain-containing protein [Seiridium cardinale]|uniref:SNF2 family N-terminal domain-containing protein n=1 Tax=Seiridium cardinale TaxID=138064 RepID=A0ABR2XSH6_9PEZI
MGAPKRGRDPAAGSNPRSSKQARISGPAATSSSHSKVPTGSQSSQFPASTQVIDDEEAELIDLTQDDEGSAFDLYGTHDAKIVGVRYYNGLVTPHELVMLQREPHNPYDPNAIRVNNVMGQQIGHLPRTLVTKLAPYVDQDDIVLEGVLTGEKGFYDCPIRLYFYGSSEPTARAALENRIKADKLLKATDMKKNRQEAEARKNAMGMKSGTTTGSGLGNTAQTTLEKEEQDSSLQNLVAASEALDSVRTGTFTDALAIGEDQLQNMPMANQPDELKSTLLPYQLQGLAWMTAKENAKLPPVGSDEIVQLWQRKSTTSYLNLASCFATSSPPQLISGGILADDMGLGKTLEIISLIVSEGLENGPTLIVAPVSVLSNWEQQIKFHVKEDQQPSVLVYHSCKPMSAAELRKYHVVVTTYGMLSSEAKVKNSSRLFGVEWRRVVLDEGHTIRNAKAQLAQAAHMLKAKSRWVLTGTPIINNVKDFYSLLKFLKLTGGLQEEGLFSQVIARPIKQAHSRHPDRIKAVNLLGHLMKDICLRRKKEMKFVNLNLPPKTEYIHRVSFDKTEKTKYDALLAEAQGALEEFQKKSKNGQLGRYTNVLERLLRLRQVCNHWTLAKERVNDLLKLFEDQQVVPLTEKNIPILQKALQLMIDSGEECAICFEEISQHQPVITACKHVFGRPCIARTIDLQGKCPYCRAELTHDSLLEPAETAEKLEVDDLCRSSKTEALVKILQATLKNKGSKVIIFSQWTSFLDIIGLRLHEAGLTFARVDGSMVKKKRDASIAALNEDPDTRILLASLQVCSVGLNLVAADTVVLADSWWAPAIEDQAVDRVHRLGQTRPTTVWRLIVENTIEERVLDIQAEKRKLVSEAFQEEAKGAKAKDTRSLADIKKLLS